jgi:NTE family protein
MCCRVLHCDEVNRCSTIKLFVTATHVASGQARVFTCEEITPDVLLASACIPLLFQAVTIDGEDYWDGGYMGNPTIWPLIYHTDAHDVVLVQINPVKRAQTPTNAADIMNRLNEITFNASLIAELRAIQFVKKLIKSGRLKDDEYKNMRMHHIAMPGIEEGITAESKMRSDWAFFKQLHAMGRQTAEHWLQAHKKDLGVRASLNVEKFFLHPIR